MPTKTVYICFSNQIDSPKFWGRRRRRCFDSPTFVATQIDP